MRFDAIVLCGGDARRLGGADKAAVVVGGNTLLERALDAVSSAKRTIAVGPSRTTKFPVAWTREEPPGGGPVAAIAAGMQLVEEDVVVVLGVDFPFVDPQCVARIVAALADHDGAILRDDTGRHQFLVGAYRRGRLVDALEGRDARDMSVKELIEDLDLVVLEDPRATRDCDSWADVKAAEELLS
jgi:molybdopterin-guanine dinucleotide biosynthesis protein A